MVFNTALRVVEREKQHLFMVGGGVLYLVVSGRLFEWWRGNFFELLGEWGLVFDTSLGWWGGINTAL